ncbi:hypothetical protein QYE76_040338 [Lolium multiflorum]|uniref:Cyclin N-terminal domain-containing protein n=1 Tax=Lolium multiflorum TaxID=4521 RepID=A0AAD8TB00_LOLMU|nr:hypothetical protein QYE76_040338 [Lolium multiflorum]
MLDSSMVRRDPLTVGLDPSRPKEKDAGEEVEKKRRQAADYIERVRVGITPNMRGILVDLLVEEYKLVSDTLYLTVSYIDR